MPVKKVKIQRGGILPQKIAGRKAFVGHLLPVIINYLSQEQIGLYIYGCIWIRIEFLKILGTGGGTQKDKYKYTYQVQC